MSFVPIGGNQRGLFALLLIVLEWTCPGLLSPLRPICDLRVLNHFVQEARDAEDAMRSCREGCGLTQTVSVPQTKVNIEDWEKKNALEQAEEVQTGLWLLQQALGSFGPSVTNTALNNHIDNTAKNLVSINAVLRSLNFQVREVVFFCEDLLRISICSFCCGKLHLFSPLAKVLDTSLVLS
uniref:Erythropoietin n=1 Tax=Oryzias sinensis TaxID=183150 RepID=A0A8C7XBR4_9TELE